MQLAPQLAHQPYALGWTEPCRDGFGNDPVVMVLNLPMEMPPSNPLEDAEIDGASTFQIYRKITVPHPNFAYETV